MSCLALVFISMSTGAFFLFDEGLFKNMAHLSAFCSIIVSIGGEVIEVSEMNERELLNAILFELRAVRAKVDATADDLLHFRKEMQEFKTEMNDFRKETANNFNKVDRRLRFVETDYDQLNNRVDKIELGSNH
jgi:uncharacterized protein (DUF3084 family)